MMRKSWYSPWHRCSFLSVDSNKKVVLQLTTIQSTPCKTNVEPKNHPFAKEHHWDSRPPWLWVQNVTFSGLCCSFYPKTIYKYKINKVFSPHQAWNSPPPSGEVGLFELQLDTVMILSCLPFSIHQNWYFLPGHGWLIFLHGVLVG